MEYTKVLKYRKGMTLIEVLVYTALLSFLLSSFIWYVYIIHVQNIKLIDEINDSYI